MDSPPRGCAVPMTEGPSSAVVAARMAIVRRARGAWPIGRHAAWNAWPPSAKRTRTASLAPSAAASIWGRPAPSPSAVACPKGSVARGSTATPCPFRRRGAAVRDWYASRVSAAPRAGWRTRRAVPRATRARTAMTDRAVTRTAASSGVPRGNAASAWPAMDINVWRVSVETVPNHPVVKASAATCACPGVRACSGVPACATRSWRTVALRTTCAEWGAPRSAPAIASATRWSRAPVARGGVASRSRKT